MYFLLILMLIFTATAGQNESFFIVRLGDEVTLPCENVSDGQNNCDRTTWSFSGFMPTVTLFKDGQLMTANMTTNKSERLNVTADCSLVIKKVDIKDVGRYVCRQLTSGQELFCSVYLSVIYMTEQTINDSFVFNCSVVDYNYLTHKVEWLYEGKAETSLHSYISPPAFHSSVALTAPLHQNSELYGVKCKVTNNISGKVQLFTFGHQSQVQTTGPTWWPIVVSVVSTSILIIIVVKWKKTEGREKKSKGNADDPEEQVVYASVCHRKDTKGKKKVSCTVTNSPADLSSPKAPSNQDVVYSTLKHKESDFT